MLKVIGLKTALLMAIVFSEEEDKRERKIHL